MAAALEIKDLNAWYGESHILHGISLEVPQGQVVTLLGRNGAGRTTLLRAIMGLTGARPSEISSSKRMSAPVRRMRATASICCSPPESRVPGLFLRSARLGNIA